MKKLGLLLLAVIFTVGCSSTKTAVAKDEVKQEKNTGKLSFEYEASTRGAYRKVVITKDSVVTILDHEMKNVTTKPTKKADWDNLNASYNKIRDQRIKLEELKAPSNKSFSDGAMGANLKIIVSDQIFYTPTFDHGNPPAEVAILVGKIILMSDFPKTK